MCHTFWRYNKTSSLGRTAVDSLDDINQLKGRKRCILSSARAVYLLLVIHGPVAKSVVNSKYDLDSKRRLLASCCCFRYQGQS